MKEKIEILDKLCNFELEWKIDKKRFPEFFKNKNGYTKGDENCPFFSETTLYNLFGKEDARTILALVRHLARAAGISEKDIYERL